MSSGKSACYGNLEHSVQIIFQWFENQIKTSFSLLTFHSQFLIHKAISDFCEKQVKIKMILYRKV